MAELETCDDGHDVIAYVGGGLRRRTRCPACEFKEKAETFADEVEKAQEQAKSESSALTQFLAEMRRVMNLIVEKRIDVSTRWFNKMLAEVELMAEKVDDEIDGIPHELEE